ncbi:MAG TPA: YsnF/AvaK domain-containing protein [Anaerolineaceae bacterium]|nr:YsnF/AvaK domain-containing protein [Anaerolineaceae bacterium]
MKTVVGLYERFEQANDAVKALLDSGFSEDEISMVARDQEGRYSGEIERMREKGDDISEGTATGAGIGAVAGGVGGFLLSLGALAIPGIGPIVAAGPLLATLTGAGVGALAGGLIGALADLGIPEEQARYYSEGVKRGGHLVLVRTRDDKAGLAEDIMNRFNPINVKDRMAEWSETADEEMAIPTTGQDVTFPVLEEELRIGKREIDAGGVRVHTYTTDEPVEEEVTLRKEQVRIERRPADRPAQEGDFEAFKKGTMEFTEKSEEPVVEKRANVVEEVHVSKDIEEERRMIHDTLRKTNVDVEEFDQYWDRNQDTFRQHYQSSYARTGRPFSDYSPAYAYGYALSRDNHYRDYDWNRLESEARMRWQEAYDTPWDDVREAVRAGWEREHRM